jgi:hypothetical protein
MNSINRAAVVIKPKQPFVDWLNSIHGEKSDYTLEKMPKEHTTYLIPEFFGPNESLAYIKKTYSEIFGLELFAWYTPEELWPKKRNWEMFQEWFSVEINSEVFDLVDGEIEKEEM